MDLLSLLVGISSEGGMTADLSKKYQRPKLELYRALD